MCNMTRRSSKCASLALSLSIDNDNESPLVVAPPAACSAKSPLSPIRKTQHHRRRSSLLQGLRSPFRSHYPSSCAETDEESDPELEEPEQEEPEIHLITKPNHTTVASFKPALNFAQELEQATATSCGNVALELHGFIERATRHDIYKLRDLIVQYGDSEAWKGKIVRIHDTAYATNFRRFAYKKDNISHHIQRLCQRYEITLDYRIAVDLDVDDIAIETVVSLLEEIQKHPEVRSLQVFGHLNYEQETLVLKAMQQLVRLDDRDWDALHIYTAYSAAGSASAAPQEYEEWVTLMQEYMGIFSQLYEQYNIPIDIRPCATV